MKKARNPAVSRRSIEVRALATAPERTALERHRTNAVMPTERHRAKNFSLWKGKLAKAAAIHMISAPPDAKLVPVTIRPNVVKGAPTGLGLTVTLPNGIGLRVEVPGALSLAPLLRELAGLSC